MRYFYKEEDKKVTFCYNNETLFDSYNIEPDLYNFHVWTVPDELTEQITELGYSVKWNDDYHAWHGGFLSGGDDKLPEELGDIFHEIYESFEKHIEELQEMQNGDEEDDDCPDRYAIYQDHNGSLRLIGTSEVSDNKLSDFRIDSDLKRKYKKRKKQRRLSWTLPDPKNGDAVELVEIPELGDGRSCYVWKK